MVEVSKDGLEDIVLRLKVMADLGDYGRKPDPLDVRRLAVAALTTLQAERDRYRVALEPFAAVAEHDIGMSEGDSEKFIPMNKLNRAPLLTVGDLRRARTALSDTPTVQS